MKLANTEMFGGLSVSEYAMEVVSLMNYTHNSLFSCGFLVLRKPIVVIESRRKRQNRIATSSALRDAGGVVLDEDFVFKPSFDEYLKAMESVKIDRENEGNYSDTCPRKMKGTKKIVPREEKGNIGVTAVKGNSRKGDFFHRERSTLVQEDSRKDELGQENVPEKFQKKQNKNSRITGKKNDGSDGKFLDFERAAFSSMYSEDCVIGKPRVTKADMEERIQRLAKCLNGADIDMPEWKFSKMMRSAQIRFSDHSILRIVQILGDLGNWRRVLQVIEWIHARERYKSHKIRHIYTAALNALGKARRPVEALNLFHRMQGQMASYPDMVAYHCIAVTLGQAGHMKELFDVIDTMRSPPRKKFKTDLVGKWDPRLEPDVIVYNAVLNACVQRKKWEGAFWVLQQLRQQGQQPPSTTYGLVMEVMLACGKYNLVHDFFKKIQKSYIPNALVYKVLVNTLWREGKIDEAVMAVEEMEKRGIVGNAALYYDLARCLCSAGRCREALKQIDKICRVANKPLVVTYTGLIQACLERGDIENGAYIFNYMQKFCSPNIVTYNIMLKAFVDHKMFEEAKKLFQRLLENSNFIGNEESYKVRVLPDIYTFNTMLDACAAEQKWDGLDFVYGQMLRIGLHFNTKRHLGLLLDARHAGKAGPLEMTWKHLTRTGQVPPPLLTREMFCMKLEQGDYVAALSYIISFASGESQIFSPKSWSKFFSENAYQFGEHTLDGLVHEANSLLIKSKNPALCCLLESCKKYVRTQRTSVDYEQTEVANRSQNAAAFVSGTQVCVPSV